MKNLSLLVWLSQLGLSVVMPLLGFVLLAAWLRNSLGWGNWVVWVGVVLGILCAADGLRTSLKAMRDMASREEKTQPPVSFNDHD